MARDYPKEYRDFHGKPERIKDRASRNAARAKMKKAGVNVAGKDVAHKDDNPRHNSRGNLRTMSASANRSKK